jgi:hypothetical protein
MKYISSELNRRIFMDYSRVWAHMPSAKDLGIKVVAIIALMAAFSWEDLAERVYGKNPDKVNGQLAQNHLSVVSYACFGVEPGKLRAICESSFAVPPSRKEWADLPKIVVKHPDGNGLALNSCVSEKVVGAAHDAFADLRKRLGDLSAEYKNVSWTAQEEEDVRKAISAIVKPIKNGKDSVYAPCISTP